MELTNIPVVVSALIIIILIVGMMIARHFEKKEFNNGYCTVCNKRLRNFDTDSQGGRGYCCPKCGRTIWVSYPVDKNF